MKHFYKMFFLSIIILFGNDFKSNAQTPEWLWAKSSGGTGEDGATNCVVDKNGNIYVSGLFKSSTITFGETILTCKGDMDGFLVKYDQSGNVLWAKSIGDELTELIFDITIDHNGNVYAAGFFSSVSITIGNTTVINEEALSNSKALFIVKYDSNGEIVWVDSPKGAVLEGGVHLITDQNNNLYVTGAFLSDSLTLGTRLLKKMSVGTFYIAKYNTEGVVQWAHAVGGTPNSIDNGKGLTTDAAGNIYVMGDFQSQSITFGTTTLIKADTSLHDIFVTKYSTDGDVLWAKSYGGIWTEHGYGFTSDASGNLYVTGWFSSPTWALGSITLTSKGSADMFLAKLDHEGTVMWAKSVGGSIGDMGTNVITDSSGNIYASGMFKSASLDFASAAITNSGEKSNDIFLVKYDAHGKEIWVKSAGGKSNEAAIGLDIDGGGNLYLAGTFNSSLINFGTILEEVSNGDMFIVKLSSGPTSVEEDDEFAQTFMLIPNPTLNTFTITNLEPGNYTISIYSLTGEKIYESFVKESQTIDISGEAKGTYIYQLLKEDKAFKTGKFILE